MNDNHKLVIDDLYRLFSDRKPPKKILDFVRSGCYGKDILLSKSLHELTGDELGHYGLYGSKMFTAKEDLLFFLPRILDLHRPYDQFRLQDIAEDMVSLGFQGWEKDRKDVVLAYFGLVIDNAINGHDNKEKWDHDLMHCICALSKIVPDINPYLKRILAAPDNVIWCIVTEWKYFKKKNALSDSSWNKDYFGYKQMIDWLNSKEVSLLLNDALSGSFEY